MQDVNVRLGYDGKKYWLVSTQTNEQRVSDKFETIKEVVQFCEINKFHLWTLISSSKTYEKIHPHTKVILRYHKISTPESNAKTIVGTLQNVVLKTPYKSCRVLWVKLLDGTLIHGKHDGKGRSPMEANYNSGDFTQSIESGEVVSMFRRIHEVDLKIK